MHWNQDFLRANLVTTVHTWLQELLELVLTQKIWKILESTFLLYFLS